MEKFVQKSKNGIVVLDDEYVRQNRKIFIQLICNFRYGREDDEMIGLRFQKELVLVSQQVYPEQKVDIQLTRMQERLLRKLGSNSYPFVMQMPPNSPASVVLQQKANDSSQPCGVQYFVKVFAGENDCDRSHRRSTVNLGIRKVQYAPTKTGIQPCTVVRKDFLLSPGELELEVTLDKQLYHHGERIAANICVRNNSNKVVKKIKAMVQQGIDVVLFQNGQFRNTISSAESSEGCPLNPGSSLQKVMYLAPNLAANCDRAGIAVEGDIKHKNTSLASTTLIASHDTRDAFGIIVSYAVKVKLFLGALGGELCAELPFILMHPKICDQNMVISFVDARHPGRNHDAFIWEHSAAHSYFELQYSGGKRNTWLLGDGGYKLQPYLMKPYKNAVAPHEKMFNDKHCKMRNVIERCFGVLKNRFRCLIGSRGLHYSPEKAAQIVNVCCALHNMCIFYKNNWPQLDTSTREGDEHIETEEDAYGNMTVANSIRDRIAFSL